MTLHISSTEEFKKQVLEYHGVCLVDFWAEWCGPCRMLGPIMDELATQYTDKDVKIVKVNVDENGELAAMFQVMSIPAVFVIAGGKPVDAIVGVNPKNVYEGKIDVQLANIKPAA